MVDPGCLGAPTVVMVPGYSLAPDPKSTDSSPSVELAGAFHSWGYNTLIINPGYATGAHPYTGGPLEAKDIKMAVSWCHHHGGNVAVWGFSAGGHSSLLAAANGASITAVAADSAFVNAQAVIAEQAARVVHLPGAVFFPAPRLLRWWYPPGPADLRSELRTHPIKVPVLLIQGTADTAIAPTNLQELARLTGGTVWSVPGADHTKSYFTDRSGYLQRARAFLEAHLPPGNPAAR